MLFYSAARVTACVNFDAPPLPPVSDLRIGIKVAVPPIESIAVQRAYQSGIGVSEVNCLGKYKRKPQAKAETF